MFENVLNFVLPAGQAAGFVESAPIRRDETGDTLLMEFWQTGGGSNVYLFRGRPQPSEAAAAMVGQGSAADLLGVVPAGAVGRRYVPDDVTDLSVYSDSAVTAGSPQVVTVRITKTSGR